jgi:uncharacterized glyoxalase superfamily protein PhnB
MSRLARIAPELPVANLRRSVEYYRDRLGFQNVMTTPGKDYAVMERDDVAVHLYQDDAGRHTAGSIHIFTAGLDELLAELISRGARVKQGIVRQPWGNRDFRVQDDSGNELKFTEPLEE